MKTEVGCQLQVKWVKIVSKLGYILIENTGHAQFFCRIYIGARIVEINNFGSFYAQALNRNLKNFFAWFHASNLGRNDYDIKKGSKVLVRQKWFNKSGIDVTNHA